MAWMVWEGNETYRRRHPTCIVVIGIGRLPCWMLVCVCVTYGPMVSGVVRNTSPTTNDFENPVLLLISHSPFHDFGPVGLFVLGMRFTFLFTWWNRQETSFLCNFGIGIAGYFTSEFYNPTALASKLNPERTELFMKRSSRTYWEARIWDWSFMALFEGVSSASCDWIYV